MAASSSAASKPDHPPGTDSKNHCYTSCPIAKCMLWIPVAPAIGLAKEDLETIGGQAEIDEMRANNVGAWYAHYAEDCKEACDCGQ